MSAFHPLPNNWFRLLRLSPNTPEHTSYELGSFELGHSPCYNALSYCWGELERSIPIQCNGSTMMITPHLEEAIACLGTLKRDTEWIWIDQICINQDDDLERALQVSMMKDIYTSSEGTIIWLGSHVEDIETVPPFLRVFQPFIIEI